MYSQDFARFLAYCSTCRQVNSIVYESRQRYGSSKKAERTRCLMCGRQGPSYEHKDTQALVVQTQLGARLELPSADAVADARTIRQVLNTALIVRFKLRVCLATEGGVQGVVRKRYIELRNDEDQIGLWSDNVGERSQEVTGSVLAFYARMLADLFVRELRWEGGSMGCGAALTARQLLAPLLHVVLSKTVRRNEPFARLVFHEWANLTSNPLAQRFVAGLTDADITELYVEPPW